MTQPNDIIMQGLTKREYFVIMALQGILSAKYPGNTLDDDILLAVNAADNLITALNEDQT